MGDDKSRRSLSLLLAGLLVGCAATQTDPTTVSNIDLCRYSLNGGQNAVVADAEASRRGLDCRTYYQAIQNQNAQRSRALNAAAAIFNQPGPALPFPRQTDCTSRAVGNTVQTTCR